jgi:crotonobetainyl-CoA:carnitine CoA-transferase CaiB-like acyl-CoA transferase
VLGRDLPSADADLASELEEAFRAKTAADWVSVLDDAGVPAEVSNPDYVLSLFDDQEMKEKGWVTSYEQPLVGHMDAAGLMWDFSETPGRIYGPPLVPGQDSRTILAELGYDDEHVAKLIASGVVTGPNSDT